MIEYIVLFILILISTGIIFKSMGNRGNSSNSSNANEQHEENPVRQVNENDMNDEDNSNNTNNINNHMQNYAEIDPNKSYTKKELHKMEKKKAKAEEKEMRENILKMKQEKKLEQEKKYEEKEKKRKEDEKKEEELVNKLKIDKEQKELEEYKRWESQISVKEEGQNKVSLNKSDFIKYIKLRKIVSLEDLAGIFKLTSKEVVFNLEMMENEGEISGIIDDRGKYIYLTEKEIVSIEKNLISRGRISKQDIINFCNKSIKFSPSEEYKQQILEESNQLLSQITDEKK